MVVAGAGRGGAGFKGRLGPCTPHRAPQAPAMPRQVWPTLIQSCYAKSALRVLPLPLTVLSCRCRCLPALLPPPQAGNFRAMEKLGEATMKPFLQVLTGWEGKGGTGSHTPL